MKTLLHTCCAPCSIECINALKNEGISPTLFWFNPNIHPYTEYKARKEGLINHAANNGLYLEIDENYGLREFINGIYPAFDNRCEYCYRTRLFRTAEYAKANGYDCFSATLLISPYQNHELIRRVGEEAAAEFHASFLYRDFRPFFRDGQKQARELGVYMQKYCGCIFSEEERYCSKKQSIRCFT